VCKSLAVECLSVTMARYLDERQHALDRNPQSMEILVTNPADRARSQDAIDRLPAEPWHAQQLLARAAIDVNGEMLPMAECPCELWIDVQIEHAVRPAEDLVRLKAIEA